jgi:hypothetical protein
MTTQELYSRTNSLCNDLDSALRERSLKLSGVGADSRFIQLGKLQEAFELVADARTIISAVNRETPPGS